MFLPCLVPIGAGLRIKLRSGSQPPPCKSFSQSGSSFRTVLFCPAAFFPRHGFLFQLARFYRAATPAENHYSSLSPHHHAMLYIEKVELTSIRFCPSNSPPWGPQIGRLGLFSGFHPGTRLSVPACSYLFRLAMRACRRSRILTFPAPVLRSCKAREKAALISPVSSWLTALSVGFLTSFKLLRLILTVKEYPPRPLSFTRKKNLASRSWRAAERQRGLPRRIRIERASWNTTSSLILLTPTKMVLEV